MCAFPQFEPGRTPLETGLNNPNPMGHVPSYLCNLVLLREDAGKMGRGGLYLDELMTEPLNRVMDRLDEERLAVIEGLGLDGVSVDAFSKRAYPPGSRVEVNVPRVGSRLMPRFLMEDIPAGLIPIASFGKLVDVETPLTLSLIELACVATGIDFWNIGRTLENLGLDGLEPKAVVAAFKG